MLGIVSKLLQPTQHTALIGYAVAEPEHKAGAVLGQNIGGQCNSHIAICNSLPSLPLEVGPLPASESGAALM